MKLLKYIIKKIAYLAAFSIIILAVLTSTAHLLTPVFNQHRTDFEKWASVLLERPIKIESVHIAWSGFQPELSLDGVILSNKDTKAPVVRVERVSVYFSIPRSLWHRQPTLSTLTIQGADINLLESPSGAISLQGFPMLEGPQLESRPETANFEEILAWLSREPHLILRDIDVHYEGKIGGRRFVTLHHLDIENSGKKHLILGKAILQQAIPTEVSTAIEWEGDKLALDAIKARLYLYVSGFSVSQWLKAYTWHDWRVTDGVASAKIWADWQQGQFSKIQTRFELYKVDFLSTADQTTHQFNRVSGNLGWKRDGENQIFAGDDILIDFPEHLWPVSSFYAKLIPDEKGQYALNELNIGYIDVTDVQTLLFSSPAFLTDEARTFLTKLKLKGAIENASFKFNGPYQDLSNIVCQLALNHIGFAPWSPFPGINNLSAKLRWDGKQGAIEFASQKTSFQYDAIFNKPLALDNIAGKIDWKKTNPDDWTVNLSNLQIANNDIDMYLTGSLDLPQKQSPYVNLNATFDLKKVANLKAYLPLQLFSPGLSTWLREAFLGGELRAGRAELRGRLSEFPFDQGDGTFTISGIAKNIDLRYASDWPVVNKIKAALNFTGRRLVVDAYDAKIAEVALGRVHAEISSIGGKEPSVLSVRSDTIQTNFTKGLQFVRSSPLKNSIGKMLEGTKITGPMTLKLGLTVPLADPDDTKVDGTINLFNTQLDLIPWRLKLSHLNGQLYFTENTTDARAIQGYLFNKPVQLQIETVKQEDQSSFVRARLIGILGMSDLQKWLEVPIEKVATGAANLVANIDFVTNQPVVIKLNSDLLGVAIDLPDQYAKQPQETRALTATIIADEKAPLRIKADYGEMLSAAIILSRQNEKLTLQAANLLLGEGEAEWPQKNGLYITGNFDQLDWEQIKTKINLRGEANFTDLPLQEIKVNAKSIDLFGQKISDVKVQMVPQQNSWNIAITSPDISGKITVPQKLSTNDKVIADFDKLKLKTASGGKEEFSIDMRTLPSIEFSADDVNLNDIALGDVYFKTKPGKNGLTIESLNISSNYLHFGAAGEWTQSNITRLHGNIMSKNVSAFLSSLGFDVHNFIVHKGDLDFDLEWQGTPFMPSLNGLSGDASIDIGAGRIVEVSQTSGTKMGLGRMLSLFSLQTIPRRLSLDFSDIVEKGYSFDFIRGNFTFKDGDAHTTNLVFDGPVAKIQILGRIGLRDQDYDLTLGVMPHVTSSIPAAATILSGGNPLVGIGAFAVTKVLGPQFSKLIGYYYAVKGPWNNPTWEQIRAPK